MLRHCAIPALFRCKPIRLGASGFLRARPRLVGHEAELVKEPHPRLDFRRLKRAGAIPRCNYADQMRLPKSNVMAPMAPRCTRSPTMVRLPFAEIRSAIEQLEPLTVVQRTPRDAGCGNWPPAEIESLRSYRNLAPFSEGPPGRIQETAATVLHRLLPNLLPESARTDSARSIELCSAASAARVRPLHAGCCDRVAVTHRSALRASAVRRPSPSGPRPARPEGPWEPEGPGTESVLRSGLGAARFLAGASLAATRLRPGLLDRWENYSLQRLE